MSTSTFVSFVCCRLCSRGRRAIESVAGLGTSLDRQRKTATERGGQGQGALRVRVHAATCVYVCAHARAHARVCLCVCACWRVNGCALPCPTPPAAIPLPCPLRCPGGLCRGLLLCVLSLPRPVNLAPVRPAVHIKTYGTCCNICISTSPAATLSMTDNHWHGGRGRVLPTLIIAI